MVSPENVGQQFQPHHLPQPEGSQWTPEHAGEPLYHGSPHVITDGVIKPGADTRAWATDRVEEASRYGKYNGGEKPVHVYEVKPIDSKDVTGVLGPRFYGGQMVKHFHSGTGFTVVRKLEPGEY